VTVLEGFAAEDDVPQRQVGRLVPFRRGQLGERGGSLSQDRHPLPAEQAQELVG
jgi:hypothetical protein